ncbi:hypothetical protein EW145_g235 [Phellinidium pouzarii]|uniref:DUF7704 domain-containing protein n=1 Tax=Phellinidium pouzarii TaxID=167371 RepID=A0A4S4LJC4_9AGAM|nr:hypothetical protein EW145_g235 [Phellinidium pouzarii]
MKTGAKIPFFPYRLFFLYIEPISALLGAFFAARPAEYLSMITMQSQQQRLAAPSPSPQVAISLFQLSNLYVLFALNECLVLSSTESLRTWRRLLFCLLVADIGHLATMHPLGVDAYWRFWDWNAMMWGSIGFVYMGAAMRLSFLAASGRRKA